MDYPRDNVFTFLFSTYKRTAGIAFTVILILAVPITVALISKQQDVRQRADTSSSPQAAACAALNQQIASYQANGLCSGATVNVCNGVRDQMTRLNCPSLSITPAPTDLVTSIPTPQPTSQPVNCTPKPFYCEIVPLVCATPVGGWCINATPTPTNTPTPTSILGTSPTLIPSTQPSPTTSSVSPTPQGVTPTPQLLLHQEVFDFNDDGKVDEIDLNILYAGFAKRQGD